MLRHSLLRFLPILASLTSAAMSSTSPAQGLEFPGRKPGKAAARLEDNRLVLQNDAIAATWSLGQGGLQLIEVADRISPNALRTGLVEDITRQDLADALDAAAAVGDDRIQERAQGRVTPEAWTHGSAEQRQSWAARGIESGSPRSCDTFRGRV